MTQSVILSPLLVILTPPWRGKNLRINSAKDLEILRRPATPGLLRMTATLSFVIWILNFGLFVIEIIPAILVKTFDEAKARIAAIEHIVEWAQIDVVDGKFAPNVTWGSPSELQTIKTRLKFEADLMIIDPDAAIASWISAGVKRILFHQEAVSAHSPFGRTPSRGRAHHIISAARAHGVEVGMSINPKTSHETLYSFVPRLDCVLLLGVEPGFGGQELKTEIFDKIRALRAKFPQLPIEIDGGVKAENARALVEAGATRLCAGSFIFSHPKGPEEAIMELKEAVGGQSYSV